MSSKTGSMLIDRSGADLDDKCGMARWWNRHEQGIGLVPAIEHEALTIGKEIHEDLEWAAKTWDGSEQMLAGYLAMLTLDAGNDIKQETKESLWRRMGWLTAYCLFIEPDVRATYETVAVEGELLLDRTPLWVAVTPDRLLRNRASGVLVYREYKSTISASYKWTNSWKWQIQLHLGMAAIEEEMATTIGFAQVMGLMKGDNRNGRLIHPYVWAWYNRISDKWTHEYAKARGGEWNPRPVWDFPGGIIAWVKSCGVDEAKAQFPFSPPVFLRHDLLEDWVGRKTHREKVIRQVADECQDSWESRVVHFEPRLNSCEPAYGFPCPYLPLCWNKSIRQEPIRLGGFIKRTPHHIIELLNED